MPFVRGRIDHVVHQTGSFFVLSMKVDETDFAVRDTAAKISGHLCGLPRLRAGATIHLVGDWVRHPKYGRQFKPSGWYPWSQSLRDTERFLSECCEGFTDWDMVKRIVSVFGEDTFETLSSPEKVTAIFTKDDARQGMLQTALLCWRTARTLADLSLFLQDYDLGPETVKVIFEKFGHDAIDVIAKNPYRLISVDGFTFARADRVASRLGIARNDPRRIEGAVLWLLRTEAQQGHLFVRRGDMPALLQDLVQVEMVDSFDTPDLFRALQEAVERLEAVKVVLVDPTAGVYLPELHLYERHGATRLAQFLTPSELDVDLDTFLADYQQSNQIELSDAQRDAVRKLVEHRVLVLTGLPGTGKTTVIRTFVRLFKKAGISFALMAPTGIAAKRLASVTSEDAMTIHRSLGYNGATWGFNSGNKFGIGAAIVDEMSMVDQELFFRILDALHPSTMLVLVGDDAQLPSVGPGNVLRELISCPDIPNVRLTQIFRQATTSDIVIASHKINKGDSPLPEQRRVESEFQFVQVGDEEKIVELIVEMAAKLKSRDANFQVLSPKYDGTVGVTNLNERLRDRLNPATVQREWKVGKLYVREGDRLMVVHNNYQLNVYNGDMGKLVAVEKEHLVVRVHGIGSGSVDAYVNIPKDIASSMLRLAYAITVHKSQGSEFDTIVMPITRTQGRMLQRNLFYTAVTRARKKVWLLGESSAVLRAIANDKVVQRNTLFGRSITEAHAKLLAGVSGRHERDREKDAIGPADA